ncbi:predicted protein [Sclerotinia sclerotiorum 1980 UF-70]|uniref:Uncharacterized protein n=2 Tax=Sclerotinia sclerotiorum (strain ATCC 18683 / 1980 / Ss-1) TaxID=665079 RepID=A7EGF4_SCLS1|nr:predicted protein [Sclerotinia sclerotiorum 1980 UF-70]APA06942.1 hypothetical protein sscle_02g017120 [Sclerotinia sclerotiorum 1980 UF-70]EDO01920.1 predicted protein [Sclerotinia sclerotiorum 1980 UF-70]
MSMILVKFTRLPIPPHKIDTHNAHEYEPWYEAVEIMPANEARETWTKISRKITSSIHNHHRNYKYWNYLIDKMEVMWKLGLTQTAPQLLYAYSKNENYLELHDGQHERIATALSWQKRERGDYMHVTYKAGPSSQGHVGMVSFMEP